MRVHLRLRKHDPAPEANRQTPAPEEQTAPETEEPVTHGSEPDSPPVPQDRRSEQVPVAEWYEAVERNQVDALRGLLARGLDPDSRNRQGRTMLQLAVEAGSADIVDVLIESGADVNIAGGDALLEAAARPKPRIVRSLLEAGADVNARTSGGYSALDIASSRRYTESVELLRAAAAKGDGGPTGTEPAVESVETTPRARFVDNGDGTVTDTESGLMWECAEDGTERDYAAAEAYCEQLALAGHADWRLPGKEELAALARAGIDELERVFPDLSRDRYWAVSPPAELEWADEPERIAYTVDFDPGSANFGQAITYFRKYPYSVRAVRP